MNIDMKFTRAAVFLAATLLVGVPICLEDADAFATSHFTRGHDVSKGKRKKEIRDAEL